MSQKDFVPYPLEREGLDKICKWSAADPNSEELRKLCPHYIKKQQPRPKICDNILEAIGHTPLVRLTKLPELAQYKDTEFLVKCEFMNPGGSSKDRIGLKMIEAAQKQGKLKPGGLIIEPTSGNTGIGLALAAAVKGYKLCCVLKQSIGEEKLRILRGLGATVVRARADVKSVHPDSYLNVSLKIHLDNPGSFLTDQYSNPYNGIGHYETVGEELCDQCDDKIDYMVIGAGTCGTMTGIARKLKERIPNVCIVGADPVGSILYRPDPDEKKGGYKVEGIGRDFIPRQLDYNCVDKWVKIADKEGFHLARSLLRHEGLFCGSSSGSAVLGAIQLMKSMSPEEMKGKRVVIHLPDTIRNYLSAHLDTEWMIKKGWMTEEEAVAQTSSQNFYKLPKWGEEATIGSLLAHRPASSEYLVFGKSTAKDALDLIKKGSKNIVVVEEAKESKKFCGILTSNLLLGQLHRFQFKLDEPFNNNCLDKFPRFVKADKTQSEAIQLLKQHPYLVIERDVSGEKSFDLIHDEDFLEVITSPSQ